MRVDRLENIDTSIIKEHFGSAAVEADIYVTFAIVAVHRDH